MFRCASVCALRASRCSAISDFGLPRNWRLSTLIATYGLPVRRFELAQVERLVHRAHAADAEALLEHEAAVERVADAFHLIVFRDHLAVARSAAAATPTGATNRPSRRGLHAGFVAPRRRAGSGRGAAARCGAARPHRRREAAASRRALRRGSRREPRAGRGSAASALSIPAKNSSRDWPSLWNVRIACAKLVICATRAAPNRPTIHLS